MQEINQASSKKDSQKYFHKEGAHVYVGRSLITHDKRCFKTHMVTLG